MYRLAALVVTLVSLSGLPQLADSKGLFLDVPFVSQPKDGCGAATVSMVMQYWSKQRSQPSNQTSDVKFIQRELAVAGVRGVYASAIEGYFQRHGFRSFSFEGEWKDLEDHLAKGRPLIVAVKPSRSDSQLHYVVVVGLDPIEGTLLLNDPARRKLLKQDRAGFEKQWQATGRWTLLALPQSDNPG
jgi:predicted double-glycine peptidase